MGAANPRLARRKVVTKAAVQQQCWWFLGENWHQSSSGTPCNPLAGGRSSCTGYFEALPLMTASQYFHCVTCFENVIFTYAMSSTSTAQQGHQRVTGVALWRPPTGHWRPYTHIHSSYRMGPPRRSLASPLAATFCGHQCPVHLRCFTL